MIVTFGGKNFEIIGDDLNDILLPFKADGKVDLTVDLKAQNYDSYEDKTRFVYATVSKYLFGVDVPRIHSSAVIYKGNAYAFIAPSGTGKSTHARLWNKLAKAEYINDDQPYYKMGEQIVVYPSPWSGKHKRYSTSSAPLKAFIVIKQAKQNKIYKVDKKSALSYLYKQIVQHDEDELRIKMLEYMQKIVEQIPFYLLECDVSSLAFITCFEEVTGEKYEN